jgi:3-(3-hydroxy-phenyl)propionate hydroxylase
MTDDDVIVVGAGPTGVTLATLLARHGKRVCVLERHADVYPLPRAVHLDAEVYRVLHDLGVGAEFAAISRATRGLQLVDARQRVLARFERTVSDATGLPEANLFDQPELERVLRANLARCDAVTLLGGHEVVAVSQTDERAVVEVRAGDGGPPRRLEAAYVVGCDGANSLVRSAIGATMTDLGFEQRWLVVDVRSDVELTAWDGVHQVCNPRRAATYMRIGDDRYRFEIRLLDDETPAQYADLAALRSLIDPWLGAVPDDRLQLLRAQEYTFRARVADRWRDRRLLIAGDAAHLTPPFIGQGMCAGIRDAVNLSWKLAAVDDGLAGEGLLDSYQQERAPHAVALIRLAVNIGRAMTGGGAIAAVVRKSVLGVLRHVPAVGEKVLDATTPPLRGPLVDRRLPKAVRGTLLPLVRLGPDRALVDSLLGGGLSVVALPGVELPDALVAARVRLLTVAAGSVDPGEQELARWLGGLGVRWALLRPDRVVQAIGSTGAEMAASVDRIADLSGA